MRLAPCLFVHLVQEELFFFEIRQRLFLSAPKQAFTKAEKKHKKKLEKKRATQKSH